MALTTQERLCTLVEEVVGLVFLWLNSADSKLASLLEAKRLSTGTTG